MNANQNPNNDPLHNVMRGWKVTGSLPPRFQEQVWKRIELAESLGKASPWKVIQTWLERVMARPTVAASYVMLLLSLGLVSGYWQGREKATSLDDRLSTRYVQSVDPYQMPTR